MTTETNTRTPASGAVEAASLIGKGGDPDCWTCHGSGQMQTTMDTLNPHEGGAVEPCDRCPGLPGARVRLANMARDIDLGLTPLCAWPDQLSNPTSAKAKATAHDIGLVLAALTSSPKAEGALTVWYGKMPESNGRENWTAQLCRKADKGFDFHTNGYTFARSEYPDRVRYEADHMAWLIGERSEKPNLLDYDADKHSGYAAPQPLQGGNLSPKAGESDFPDKSGPETSVDVKPKAKQQSEAGSLERGGSTSDQPNL